MKFVFKLIVLIYITIGLNAHAADKQFDLLSELKVSSSYEDAIYQAKKENKNVVMYMYQDYCPWCSKMKRDTLSNNGVIKYLNDKFIFLKIDSSFDDYPQAFKPNGVPTTFLINAKTEKKVMTLKGYKSPKSFLNRLKRAN